MPSHDDAHVRIRTAAEGPFPRAGSRGHRPTSSPTAPSRRTFLLGTAATLAGAALAGSADQLAFAQDAGLNPAGTTLAEAAVPEGGGAGGYRKLTAGPGYAFTVLQDAIGQEPKASRADTRTPLASVVQFTDLHVLDAQSPMRFEYLHDITGSAFRPHESLSTQGAVSLIERVNDLRRGPHTGRTFDCVVSTGDNTDNHEHVELDWFLTAMNGGSITANTGDPHRWEGVQTSGDAKYWNPGSALQDRYKNAGFPQMDGLLERAMAPHTSPGLDFPWFSIFGNHDDSISGTLPADWKLFRDMYTGSVKFTGFKDPAANRQLEQQVRDSGAPKAQGPAPRRIGADQQPKKDDVVTPDQRRAPFTPAEFIRAHLAQQPRVGAAGHGFTEQNAAENTGYYRFEIAPGVVGIALDTTNRAGFTGGSLGHAQYQWLERTLKQGSSRYYDGVGRLQKQSVEDTHFLVFSHHTPDSMNNLLLEPGAHGELRHAGWDVANLLGRFPHVAAWINGHTHTNEIELHQHKTPERRFWTINTASHVDFPQQARVIELVDNRDGTLSLLTTLIEAKAPYQGDGLATLYRELSWNDPHADPAHEGAAKDHNVELLLTAPGA